MKQFIYFFSKKHIVYISIMISFATSIVSCKVPVETVISEAAQDYCRCSDYPARLLERMDTASHEQKMKMMSEIDKVVEGMGNCLQESKKIQRLKKQLEKVSRTEKLQLEKAYDEEQQRVCPHVKAQTQK